MPEAEQRQGAGPGLVLVLGSFALNGALYGSLLSRYAEIADNVEAGEAAFGAVLAIAAVGGLVGSIVAPALVRFAGDVGAVTLFGCAFASLAVGVAGAADLRLLAIALFVMTVVDGGQDVSMNALAVRVQQIAGRSVMGRAHAVWSFSLTAGTALGAAAAWAGVPVLLQVGASAVAAIALQLLTWWHCHSHLLPGGDLSTGETSRAPSVKGRARSMLIVLAIAAIAASYVESPGQEWTALLLSRGFDAAPGLAATAPLAFSVGLLVSRLLLDPLTLRLPKATIAGASGAVIVVGMVAGLLASAASGAEWQALLAIGLAGVGAGPIFPLLFGAAEVLSQHHGIAPATTTSIVSAVSRVGAISAPAVVGAITGATSLFMVFAVMAAGGFAVTVALPRALRR